MFWGLRYSPSGSLLRSWPRTGPGTPLRSSLPSSSSLRAGNSTPSRYLPTWAGRRFLKKSTVLCLLLADRTHVMVPRRGTPTSDFGVLTTSLSCSSERSMARAEGRGLPLLRRTGQGLGKHQLDSVFGVRLLVACPVL